MIFKDIFADVLKDLKEVIALGKKLEFIEERQMSDYYMKCVKCGCSMTGIMGHKARDTCKACGGVGNSDYDGYKQERGINVPDPGKLDPAKKQYRVMEVMDRGTRGCIQTGDCGGAGRDIPTRF